MIVQYVKFAIDWIYEMTRNFFLFTFFSDIYQNVRGVCKISIVLINVLYKIFLSLQVD